MTLSDWADAAPPCLPLAAETPCQVNELPPILYMIVNSVLQAQEAQQITKEAQESALVCTLTDILPACQCT